MLLDNNIEFLNTFNGDTLIRDLRRERVVKHLHASQSKCKLLTYFKDLMMDFLN